MLDLYKTAAKQGYKKAQYQLGMLYRQGTAHVQKNLVKAAKMYQKAYPQDHIGAWNNLKQLLNDFTEQPVCSPN